MPSPPSPIEVLATVYASDEDIAVRAAGDFAVLCPAWQKLASGTDGAFLSSDLWTLTSAGSNFTAAGLQAQHVVQLQKPTVNFKGGRELLAVNSVPSATALTLRRLGAASGVGAPPSPAAGLTSVQFLVGTLGPQIEEESFILNQRFSIDPALPTRTPTDIYDLRVLRYACVLGVLQKRYAAETRTSSSDFSAKLAIIRDELGEVYARLHVRWAKAAIGQDKTEFFSTRIVR